MSNEHQSASVEIDIVRNAYSNLPMPGVSRPIFIVGCGRSGTTILGTALSMHKQVKYLNEPRHLWVSAYPETDIWSTEAYLRKGKLFFTEADVDPEKSLKISRLFLFETIISGRSVLIEKLPINNFRLQFIKAIFPDARFIHIYRNGLEVARSIEKLCKEGRWFGANSYKWDRLVEYTKSMDVTNHLPEICADFFDKGLLEWRLSTEAAVTFLRGQPSDSFCEINYDDFVASPVETISNIQRFIGIENDPGVEAFVSNNVVRRTSQSSQGNLTDKVERLGGKFLPLSMIRGGRLTFSPT